MVKKTDKAPGSSTAGRGARAAGRGARAGRGLGRGGGAGAGSGSGRGGLGGGGTSHSQQHASRNVVGGGGSSAGHGGGLSPPMAGNPAQPPQPSPAPPLVLGAPPVQSYAARIRTSTEEHAAHNFYNFLETSLLGSQGDPFYIAEVKSMKSKRIFLLEVRFSHLKEFDRIFANYICNNRDRLWKWLLSAVRKFLLKHYSDEDGKSGDDMMITMKDEILSSSKLAFLDMPQSIERLVDFLKDNADALSEFLDICFEPGKSVLVSTSLGSHIFRSCVRYLINCHIQGHSWNGQFKLEDWDLINGYELALATRPEASFTLACGAADLRQIDAQLIRLYLKNDKNGEEKTPLYFNDLDRTLSKASAAIKTEDLGWFREYILAHPAYMPPIARINLIRGLFREVRTHNLDKGTPFEDILNDSSESCYGDWTVLVSTTTSAVLLNVYWHNVPEEERHKSPPPFENNLGGLLVFKRHACEHTEGKSRDKHGNQKMKRSIEAEVFTATKVDKFLPCLITKLLKKCHMKGPFEEVWQAYKCSGFNIMFGTRKGKK
ncbi:hypothetical protein ACP4OV_029074 [Aristida adscensionis]